VPTPTGEIFGWTLSPPTQIAPFPFNKDDRNHVPPGVRSWFMAHRRTMPQLPLHLRLKSFLLEQGQSGIEKLNHAYDEIGAELLERRGGIRRRLKVVETNPGSQFDIRWHGSCMR
jgi:hypothetical protein